MEGKLRKYSHATSKLINWEKNDLYNEIFEGIILDKEVEYIVPNYSPYHNDFFDNPIASTNKYLGMKLQVPHRGT